jgi:hypothetical protein
VRPTRKAVDDARAAAGSVMVDERHGTLVVAGEGRMHFYARGKLVSSVRYNREASSAS